MYLFVFPVGERDSNWELVCEQTGQGTVENSSFPGGSCTASKYAKLFPKKEK